MTLEIEEVRSLDRVADLSSDWKRVLETSGEDRIFLRPSWLMSWWKCFGDAHELLVLRVTEDNRSVGFAPLMTTTRGKVSRWRKLEFIGSGPSDRNGILAIEGRPDVHREVWDHLRSRDDWDVVELRDLKVGSPTEANVRPYFPGAEYVSSSSPHIVLEGSYDDYWTNLSRKMRSNLGRCWRRLQDEGTVFRSMRTPEEVEEAVTTLKELSDARWDIANVLKTPGMTGFVSRASLEMAKEGAVVFHTLEKKGRPIAVTMGFEDEERYLYYLSGFDPESAALSPGGVLLSRIIEEAIRRGKREVDLLRGTEPYKYRFNAVDQEHVHFRTVNRGIIRSANYALREAPLN
jgi:CelD/BcsL family acetyltransferase involved in cellulose biosynthesis